MDEMAPAGGGASGKEGAVVEVGVTLCLRRVCLYFCRIYEESKEVTTCKSVQGVQIRV